MTLSVLCSLALMLQLMSCLMHLVSLFTPAWVQMGIYVPALHSAPGGGQGAGTGGGGGGGGEAGMGNVSSAVETPVVEMKDVWTGPRVFVKVDQGLWEWCQQLQHVSPACQEPGFLSGLRVLGVMALFTLPLSLLLVAYSSCLARETRKRRVVTSLSLLTSCLSGIAMLVVVAYFALLTRREISGMLTAIGERRELSYLGWAFGADMVACMLINMAAVCLGGFLCCGSSPKPAPEAEFKLVV